MTDKPEQSAEAYLKESNLVPSYMTEDVMWEVEFDKLCNIMESYKDLCVKKACKHQRYLCADEIKYDPEVESGVIDDFKDNVLNAPSPE